MRILFNFLYFLIDNLNLSLLRFMINDMLDLIILDNLFFYRNLYDSFLILDYLLLECLCFNPFCWQSHIVIQGAISCRWLWVIYCDVGQLTCWIFHCLLFGDWPWSLLTNDFFFMLRGCFLELRLSKRREEIIDGIKANYLSIKLLCRFLCLCQQIRIKIIFLVLFLIFLHEKFIEVRQLLAHTFPKSYKIIIYHPNYHNFPLSWTFHTLFLL